jgi:hypothetical protein
VPRGSALAGKTVAARRPERPRRSIANSSKGARAGGGGLASRTNREVSHPPPRSFALAQDDNGIVPVTRPALAAFIPMSS